RPAAISAAEQTRTWVMNILAVPTSRPCHQPSRPRRTPRPQRPALRLLQRRNQDWCVDWHRMLIKLRFGTAWFSLGVVTGGHCQPERSTRDQRKGPGWWVLEKHCPSNVDAPIVQRDTSKHQTDGFHGSHRVFVLEPAHIGHRHDLRG